MFFALSGPLTPWGGLLKTKNQQRKEKSPRVDVACGGGERALIPPAGDASRKSEPHGGVVWGRSDLGCQPDA